MWWWEATPASSAAAEWLAGIGTIAVAAIAVFQEWFKSKIIRPKLKLHAHVGRPDGEKFHWEGAQVAGSTSTEEFGVYYFRLSVTNEGNTSARDVQLYVASVLRRRQDGEYEPVERFSPMNLLWTHIHSATLPVLLPKMPPRYCDLGHVPDPRKQEYSLPGVEVDLAIFALQLEVRANSLAYLLEPGIYHLKLKLAASNQEPLDYTVQLDFPGTWFEDQDKMFNEGVGLKIV